MRFDFCIGNPPYQDETSGDNDTYQPPIYNKFMDAAYSVADKVELIHPARFLFNAGSTPKEWNEKILNDDHFKVLQYVAESKDVFANTRIRGGICISYHDLNTEFGATTVFTPYPTLNSIVKKVTTSDNFLNIGTIMYIQNRFNLVTLYEDFPQYKKLIGSNGKDKRFETGIFEKIPIFSEEQVNSDDIKVYGVIKKKRVFRYFPRKYTELKHENLDKYKAVVMKSNGEGVFGEILGPVDVLEPMVAYTRSYIGIGAFSIYEEANSCKKYIKSKFARALLDAKKVTQDNPIDSWICVPLQDFTDKSDINWSTSISNIDKQLYKKYNLSDEEIDFIETNVKEME